tara:strand:+ start:54 stop:236 length:183 start_codon:yes stop_codon:yes gene_type:complete
MKVGNLVQLLDIQGDPLPEFLGLVIELPEEGKARVHWMSGGDNSVGAHWDFHRLHVLSNV